VRGLLLLFLLAPVLAAEDPWAKLDREEIEQLGRELGEMADPRWRTRAVELRRQLDNKGWEPRPGAPREVHGLSLIRGDAPDPNDARRARAPTVAHVRVTRKGCGIVLLLSAAQAIEWRIEADEGVRIEKVLLTGPQRSVVRAPEGAAVQHIGRLFAYQRRARPFDDLESAVSPRVGGLRIATYVGRVRPEGRTLVVGPGSEDWQRQMVLRAMRELHREANKALRAERMKTLRHHVFPAVVWNEPGRRVFCDCTAEGPIADTFSPVPARAFAAAVDPETGARYFLGTQGIEEHDRDGKLVATIELPPWIGPLGWASAITFDTRRRRVLVGSMMGSVAAFRPATRAWEPVRGQRVLQGGRFIARGTDGWLSGFAYDAPRDCLWSLHSTGARTTLVRLDPFGVPGARKVLKLPVRLQPGGRNGTVVAVVGDQLALLTVDWAGRQRKANRAFVVDPGKGEIVLDMAVETSPRLEPPLREDWPALWDALCGYDPYSAIRLCARGRAPLIAYLRDRWENLPRIEEARVDRALDDLGSANAVVRSHAYAILSGGSPRLVARLEKEILLRDSAEVRLAIARLLGQYRSEPDLRARLLQILAGMEAPGAATFRELLKARDD